MYLDFDFSVFFCVWLVWHYNLHFDSHCCQWHFVLFYGWVVFDAVIFCYILSINYWLTPKFFSIILLLWIVLQLIELHIFFCIGFLNIYLGVPSLNHIVVLFLGLFFCFELIFFLKKKVVFVYVAWGCQVSSYSLCLIFENVVPLNMVLTSDFQPQHLPFIDLGYMHGLAVPCFYFGARIWASVFKLILQVLLPLYISLAHISFEKQSFYEVQANLELIV